MKKEYKEKAAAFDANDPLKAYKSAFHFPQRLGKDSIYFCGNSLGLQPQNTERFVQEELENWQANGVEGHFSGEKPWVKYTQLAKSSLAKIVGAKEHEVVAMNNLTTNLHLALATFYQPTEKRKKILIERGAFPSDYYAVHSQIEFNGVDPREHLIELSPADGTDYLPTSEILDKIEELGDELALVMFPGIQYYTGQFFDIKAISDSAHTVGAMAGFDLAHAVGNVPMNLHADGADFAVWCTYKYLNSGPGSVGGMYIHESHAQNKSLRRLSGWWGHDADGRFKMDNTINHIPNIDGWQLSNSNILTQAAHLASLEVFDEAGLLNLRKKSLLLTGFLEELVKNSEVLASEINILTPSNPEERGAQLSLFLINHGKSVFNYLLERGVILDWREPNVIRVAPVPLYNSFSEVLEFVSILENAIMNEK